MKIAKGAFTCMRRNASACIRVFSGVEKRLRSKHSVGPSNMPVANPQPRKPGDGLTIKGSRGRQPFWWKQDAVEELPEEDFCRMCAIAARECKVVLSMDNDYLFANKPADYPNSMGNFQGCNFRKNVPKRSRGSKKRG